MNYLTLSDKDVTKIRNKHVYNIDKLYRMFGGLSSELTAVKDGILYLEITVSPRWTKTMLKTATQLLNCWKKYTSILQETIGCEVKIYNSSKLPGFAIHPQDIGTSYMDELIEQYNAEDDKSLIYIYKENISSFGSDTKTGENKIEKQVEISETVYIPKIELNLMVTYKQKHISNGIFELKDKSNYIIINTNPGSNIFLKPHVESTYFSFVVNPNGGLLNKRLFPSSTTPMLYTLHYNRSYLINISTVAEGKHLI